MESQRSFLVIGLVLVSFLLWQQWQLDYGPQPEQPTSVTAPSGEITPTQSGVGEDVPVAETGNVPVVPQQSVASAANLIKVNTDTFAITIDPKGGDIISADLLQFPIEQDKPEPFQLLKSNPSTLYVAQSGLVGEDGPDASSQGRPVYSAAATEFSLQGERLTVPLTFQTADGLTVVKNFIFEAKSHQIGVEYQITNNSAEAKQLQQYAQLKQSMLTEGGSMFMPTYRGAAFSTSEKRYEKYSFDEITDDNLRVATTGGWAGMLEHYFVSAWVPPQDQVNNLYSRAISDTYAIIGYTGPGISVAPGETATLSSTLYAGPKDQDTLADIARGLDLTVDYGILWWISQPLFKLLQWLHSLVGNWGAAIVLITVIVKGCMYWLTKKQYESMAKMRALAPKMQQLKDRYGDDRQKMSQGMMELYKKEKVNPMGGCFPLLLQMPIFLSLYWVLLESVELRHADFVFWITDLSVMDPFLVLPALTGLSMYMLQKLQPMTMTDPMQQKIMQWMPVAMSIFFIWFPAGLVLYWLISNVITLIQAKLIYNSMDKRGIKYS